MTPCVNTIVTLTRVLLFVVLLFVVVGFAMRRRFERFMLASASAPPVNPKKRFWIATIIGLLLFGCEALFVDQCTGLPLPLRIRLLLGAVGFVVFTGAVALGSFVAPAWHARNPQRAARRGFFLLAVAGVLVLTALYIDLVR